jgi:hypothetical protein
VQLRARGPPTIPLHVASAGSRDIRGSKQVDGLLRLTPVRCCLSAVPAEYPLLQALPGFVRLPSLSRLRFATWPRLLPAFGTRLAVKPVTSGLKSATCSALRSHAERLPLNPKSKVSLVFSFTAPLPHPYVIPVLSRWDWYHIGLQQHGPTVIGCASIIS